ncbi:hypothetical protein C7457_0609 [Thermovibrio guaymasensis]|uniref:Uncharacterized protein n=1 Tax=Thermovibrio guaymasensis TaxID=240167 RepID=A0A420W8T4_9BACT|nr:hypothetical protein [Thermovibrio guaymasensis]RKQ63729.1 hypothetical protein C7457_0609 [Thermovibrio guaymasensis]
MKALILGLSGAIAITGAAVGAGIPDDGCLVCHRLKGLSVVTEENKVKDCSISDALYAHSIHRNVGCTECHDKIEQYPHKPENAAVNCANKCHVVDPSTKKPFSHKSVFETWKESVHGKNYQKAPDIYPYCSYCHTNDLLIDVTKLESMKMSLNRCSICHENKDWTKDRLSHVASREPIPVIKNGFTHKFIKTRRDGWEIVELCASCHEDEKKMEKALEIEGIHDEFAKEHVLTAVESYKVTMHSKMLYLDRNDTRAADCLDCHTNKDGNFHDIFHKEDPRSSINEKNIELTCGRSTECHPLVPAKDMKNMATTKWVHMHPIPDSLGQKIVKIVEEFMFWLTTGTLLFAVTIVGLDLLKNLRRKH